MDPRRLITPYKGGRMGGGSLFVSIVSQIPARVNDFAKKKDELPHLFSHCFGARCMVGWLARMSRISGR